MEAEEFLSDFYQNYYTSIYNCGGLSRWAFNATHRGLEKIDTAQFGNYAKILEIGAGKGEHFPFVKHEFQEYLMLDFFEQPISHPGKNDARVTWVQCDISNLVLESKSIDRVISSCVFHHLEHPYKSLKSLKRILKPGGLFSLFLPSDPGFASRLSRELTVKRRAKKLGFEKYDLMAALEHRNHYWGLKTMVEEVFRDCEISRKYYPFPIPMGNLSLYSIWQIRIPANQYTDTQ
jgi:ubiquinone/menaquinone biosynthesis C-methylase UbiE